MNVLDELKDMREKIDSLIKEYGGVGEAPATAREFFPDFWCPEIGEEYNYIKANGERASKVADPLDDIPQFANCYPTSDFDVCQDDARKLRAWRVIQRTADKLHGERYEPGIENNYFSFLYSKWNLRFEVKEIHLHSDRLPFQITFRTEEIAHQCLKMCIDQYEELFDVKKIIEEKIEND